VILKEEIISKLVKFALEEMFLSIVSSEEASTPSLVLHISVVEIFRSNLLLQSIPYILVPDLGTSQSPSYLSTTLCMKVFHLLL
jgi:hypothetical protein